MSCPSSGQQGLYPQKSPGISWTGQACPPCWSCPPNQANYPAAIQPNQLPNSWTIQPNQSGWPNMIQPNQSFQPPLPIQPSPNPSLQPNQLPPPIPTNPLIQPVQPTQAVSPTPTNPPAQPIQPATPQAQPTPTWPAPQPGYLPSPVPPGWHGNPGQPGWPGQSPAGGAQQTWPPAPVTAPVMVPFNMNFPRGIYDKLLLTIRGQIKPDAKMFTLNFLRGNDIALHINPRFNEGGKPVLVRNHKLGEHWGREERELRGPFPFMPGHHFEMKILCTPSDFQVSVNSAPCFAFLHRIREVNQIDRINILNDVTLSSVTVDTLP